MGEVREDRAVQRAWFAVSFISDRKDYEKGSKIKRNRREKLIEIKNTADSEYDSKSAVFYDFCKGKTEIYTVCVW